MQQMKNSHMRNIPWRSKRSGIRAGQHRRNGNTGRCDGNSEDSSASTCHGRPDPGNLCYLPHILCMVLSAEDPGNEIKPVNETGEIVLSRVVVPEYIVVHNGSPRDSTAQNYYVKYKDYIKNVASSEIYATWPENTIRANVLAIMSFTLNRVYTEWYRNQGL